MTEAVNKANLLQWVGTAILAFSIPLLVSAEKGGANNERLDNLIVAFSKFEATNAENWKEMREELGGYREEVAHISRETNTHEALIVRIETQIDELEAKTDVHSIDIALMRQGVDK